MLRFWFLVTFGDDFAKIGKYAAIFVSIFRGQIGKKEKKDRKSHN